MKGKLKQIILLLGDIVFLFLALYLALALRYQTWDVSRDWDAHFGPFLAVLIFWPLIFYISDLYNLHMAVNNAKFFQLTIRAIGISGLLSAAYFYANPHIGISPKTNLLIYLLVFSILFFLWRRGFNWFLLAKLAKEKIMFIGCNNQVKELAHYLEKRPHLGYEVAYIINQNPMEKIGNIETASNVSGLEKIVERKKISHIVLAADPHQSAELRGSLLACLPLKVKITSLPNFYETITGKIPIESINQMWFLENLDESSKQIFNLAKRASDIIFALTGLVLTGPFWPLLALGIRLESPGSAFYLSRRQGKNNTEFNLIKFRSMREEGNDRRITEKNDPRVTRIGSFMRRTRIDEIPQLLNILKGDMSFIGPRPERPELIGGLIEKIPFYKERLLVKPGLSGWAQVNEYHSPTIEDTLKKLQYDLFYVKNRSFYLDGAIFLKTIATVLRQIGR